MKQALWLVILIGLLVLDGCSSGRTASWSQDEASGHSAGTQYLVLPWRDGKHAVECSFQYKSNGTPVPWNKLALTTLTLKNIERQSSKLSQYIFQLDGSTDLITLNSNDGKLPSCLHRIINDTASKQLRARYKGKTLWSYGGTKAWCETDKYNTYAALGVDVEPLTVDQIYRIEGKGNTEVAGTDLGQPVTNPYIVIFKLPDGFSFKALTWTSGGYSEGGMRGTHSSRLMDGSNCSAVWHMVADSAVMERLYSTTDPFKAHPEWTVNDRKAILSGSINKGMTKEMVLWSKGWPLDSGALQDIMKLDEWRYQAGPFDQWVEFKNGRVSQWDPGPDLP